MRWKRDSFPELYNDDFLWASAAREWEILKKVPKSTINDPVLTRALDIGILDWTDENVRQVQSTQAMRHGTVVGSRLLAKIIALEQRVRSFRKSFVDIHLILVLGR
jgi:hypothetical protein